MAAMASKAAAATVSWLDLAVGPALPCRHRASSVRPASSPAAVPGLRARGAVVVASAAPAKAGAEEIVLQPIREISGTVKLPGSKSLSNRILLLSALSEVLQAVFAAGANGEENAAGASGEEEKVHLVVSMEDGQRLRKALQLFPPQRKVVLVHIHRPAMMIPIPTMGCAVHASILKDDIVRAYRDEQKGQAEQALEGYKEICTRAEVQAGTLMTENDDVAAGLLELIAEHRITKLIIIGISKSWVNRSKRSLAAALQRGTYPSCDISFMHKGRLISISQQDGSLFAFETNGTPSSIGSRRFSLSCSSGSSPSPFLPDSCRTPSSVFWSRSTPDSLDPSQLDDPSLENAGSIFDDSRLIVILGHESIDTLRELAHHPNLTESSQGWHQAFQLKNSEISSGSQLIGGIDLVLGANSEKCGEEYWKTINGWPAAFELIVGVLNTMQQLLSHNISECNGLTPDRLSIAAKKFINRLLDVASDVTRARKSPEKLFCILYMCKAIVDLETSLRRVLPADLLSKVDRVITVLNDSARAVLREFKALIQNYSSQKVVQDGSILLITRYVMKYIRLLVKHAGILDPILGCVENFFSKGSSNLLLSERVSLTGHLVCGLISDLNKVVEEKSRLYASHSQGLRSIFLMNNAHFIIQEVEHSDIQLIVGAEWLEQRRNEFNMYMRDYMSSTWEKATFYLTVAASPPHKRLRGPGLLGIFHTNVRPWKSFESCFKETCDSQMHWKVPCPVLRSMLRENISEHVVEAYQVYLETLNQPPIGTAEDLKSKVSELFEG